MSNTKQANKRLDRQLTYEFCANTIRLRDFFPKLARKDFARSGNRTLKSCEQFPQADQQIVKIVHTMHDKHEQWHNKCYTEKKSNAPMDKADYALNRALPNKLEARMCCPAIVQSTDEFTMSTQGGGMRILEVGSLQQIVTTYRKTIDRKLREAAHVLRTNPCFCNLSFGEKKLVARALYAIYNEYLREVMYKKHGIVGDIDNEEHQTFLMCGNYDFFVTDLKEQNEFRWGRQWPNDGTLAAGEFKNEGDEYDDDRVITTSKEPKLRGQSPRKRVEKETAVAGESLVIGVKREDTRDPKRGYTYMLGLLILVILGMKSMFTEHD